MKTKTRERVSVRKLFKVDADECNVHVGDDVIAETTVGRDLTSGEALQTRCEGVVEAINWSADEHALFVWVRVTNGPRGTQ